MGQITTKQEATLMNIIVVHMTENQMTMEQLEHVYDEIKELYRKNAIMKG